METPQLIVLNLILLILMFVVNVRVQAKTVLDVQTGNSVEVVINDRGPHDKNRIIDLSGAAARGIGLIVDGVSIAQRPPEIEDRAVPVHWKDVLITGFPSSYIATLVERHSRFTMVVKVNGKDTNTAVTG